MYVTSVVSEVMCPRCLEEEEDVSQALVSFEIIRVSLSSTAIRPPNGWFDQTLRVGGLGH